MSSARLPIILSIGIGAVGGLGILLYLRKVHQHFQRELMKLSGTVVQLHQQLDDLRAIVKTWEEIKFHAQEDSTKSKNVKSLKEHPGYYSVHASSDEDEDDWQDTIGDTPFTFPEGTGAELISGDSSETVVFSPFAEVDKLLEGTDEEKQKALKVLQELHPQEQETAAALWRRAKATFFLAGIKGAAGDSAAHKELTYAAKDLAYRSIGVDPQSDAGHKWCAITVGSLGDFEGTKAKVQNGIKYKEHIDIALELNPTDPSLHYLKGRFCFGIATLSWLERKAAATLFGALPPVTMDDALSAFLEAERLKPDVWKENMLYIAKCYLGKRDVSSAVEWLRKARDVPVVSTDDQTSHSEILTLLQKHS